MALTGAQTGVAQGETWGFSSTFPTRRSWRGCGRARRWFWGWGGQEDLTRGGRRIHPRRQLFRAVFCCPVVSPGSLRLLVISVSSSRPPSLKQKTRFEGSGRKKKPWCVAWVCVRLRSLSQDTQAQSGRSQAPCGTARQANLSPFPGFQLFSLGLCDVNGSLLCYYGSPLSQLFSPMEGILAAYHPHSAIWMPPLGTRTSRPQFRTRHGTTRASAVCPGRSSPANLQGLSHVPHVLCLHAREGLEGSAHPAPLPLCVSPVGLRRGSR